MKRIGDRIRKGIPGAKVTSARLKEANVVSKHFVELEGVTIKIEVTPALRGCVYEPKIRPVSARVEDQFGFAEVQVVSFADLYAGKLVGGGQKPAVLIRHFADNLCDEVFARLQQVFEPDRLFGHALEAALEFLCDVVLRRRRRATRSAAHTRTVRATDEST